LGASNVFIFQIKRSPHSVLGDFSKGGPKIRKLSNSDARDEEKVSKIADRLKSAIVAIDPGLSLEFGKGKKGVFEFCITPDGHRSLFSKAERVAAAAPMVVGWDIFACKRRRPLEDVKVSMRQLSGGSPVGVKLEVSAEQIAYAAEFGKRYVSLVLWFDLENVSKDALQARVTCFCRTRLANMTLPCISDRLRLNWGLLRRQRRL
jgi:hypothetical protein